MSDNDGQIRSVNPEGVKRLVMVAARAGLSSFIWGQPGIGKSDIVRQIAKEMSPRVNGVTVPETEVPVFDVRLLLLEPTDIRGIPYRDADTNKMAWSEPSILPPQTLRVNKDGVVVGANLRNADGTDKDFNVREIPNDRPCILFLDELTAAPGSIQAAAYQLVLDRRVGDYRLPEKCIVIAAGNRQSDRGQFHKMPTPLANRFIHFEMTATFDDWVNWAVGDRVHPDVVGFISQYNSKLNDFNPSQASIAFATPRSWTFVSRLIWQAEKDGISDPILVRDLISGAIGQGMAFEFMAHRDFAKDVPAIKDIFSGKAKKISTKNISAQYYLSAGICYELADRYKAAQGAKDMKSFNDDVNNVLIFLMENFQKELVVMCIRTVLKVHQIHLNVKEIPAWKEFFSKFNEMITAVTKA